MTPPESTSRYVRMRFSNSLGVDRELWIEPFGDVVIIASSRTVEIVFTEQAGDIPEIEIADTSFIVHGWVHEILEVETDGSTKVIWGG